MPFVDLYFYRTAGTISVNGATPLSPTQGGIFTSANTRYFSHVPVSGGMVNGVFGPGTTVVVGMSIALPLPRPFVKSKSPQGGGIPGDSSIVVQLQDYVTQVKTDSIQLFLNGQKVLPEISKPAGTNVTTVRFQPAQKRPPDSTNTVQVVFSDTAATPVVQTNEFSFVVLNEAKAAKIVNIDFNGVRNVPGPDMPGSIYVGQSAAGGGFVWNGIAVDSRLDDGTDDDNLTIRGEKLRNSLGDATAIAFETSPVAGDNGGGPAPDPADPSALLGDYLFNNSAANLAGESPFTISGLGETPTVDLFFYRGGGTVKIEGSSSSTFPGNGIFTGGNTVWFKEVPVTSGSVHGVFGTGTTVIYGLTIQIPVPDETVGPLAISSLGGTITVSWSGAGALQSSRTITGGWANVPNASSPYPVNPTRPGQFFRLVR